MKGDKKKKIVNKSKSSSVPKLSKKAAKKLIRSLEIEMEEMDEDFE